MGQFGGTALMLQAAVAYDGLWKVAERSPVPALRATFVLVEMVQLLLF
jgi:hypothetical protein